MTYRYERNFLISHFQTISKYNASNLQTNLDSNLNALKGVGRLLQTEPNLSQKSLKKFSAFVLNDNKSLSNLRWIPAKKESSQTEIELTDLYHARKNGKKGCIYSAKNNAKHNVVILPIYRDDSNDLLLGYVTAQYRMQSIFTNLQETIHKQGLFLKIYKDASAMPNAKLHDSNTFNYFSHVNVLNKQWILHYYSKSNLAYKAQNQSVWSVFISGLVMTLVLSIYLYGILRMRVENHSEIEEKTKRLKLYTKALERSNEELTHFASIASHDLKEPLRKIRTFSTFLQDEYRAQLPEEAQTYLKHMSDSVARMSLLIDGLLSYSRISRSDQTFQKINLEKLVNDVKSDISLQILETKGEIKLESNLPEIEADPIQIRQLLQNLMSNSLKFHHPDRTPVITISCTNTSISDSLTGLVLPAIELKIVDNGIGFDAKYCKRVFRIFERLNARSNYEGSGIGLAVCKKIIERHHGEISVSSAQNVGTTFTIRLPLASVHLDS